ncbi:MAG: Hsp70 family protein [Proteobacteria bacterium]|nr:Hsp70 family protein [Pseudomonadota bacterium]MBI3497269.1 Hsp70 family protein [Pseudomonadota bacterium]
MSYCGLDFGTSNSTIGLGHGNGVRLAPLEGTETTLPTAIFFHFEGRAPDYGRKAIASYADGLEGRLLRSLKSVLGTELIKEETQLRRRRVKFTEVIGLVVSHLKAQAEAAAGRPLEAVVHGRPVHFVDGDAAADRRAEATLAEIAHASGFRHVSFQLEPIGAALHYEQNLEREVLALIADIGGGTSDFSLVRLGPDRSRRAERADDVLANHGVRVGGTDFDRLLSLEAIMPALGYGSPMARTGLPAPVFLFHDLATWAKINFLYRADILAAVRDLRAQATEPHLFERLLRVLRERLGHALAFAAEEAKIELSHDPETRIDMDLLEPALGVPVDRGILEYAIAEPTRQIARAIDDCLAQAGVPAGRVERLFLTGGSTLVPTVRQAIEARVPGAEVVEGDRFGAIGLGLALEAKRRYA